jgi:hypothetical protein
MNPRDPAANRFGRSLAMFQDTEWNELGWPYPAGTGLLDGDELEEERPPDADEDDGIAEAVEELNPAPGAAGLRADGRRRSDEDDDLDDDLDDDSEEFEDEEETLDEEFEEDLDDEEGLDDDLDDDLEEEDL